MRVACFEHEEYNKCCAECVLSVLQQTSRKLEECERDKEILSESIRKLDQEIKKVKRLNEELGGLRKSWNFILNEGLIKVEAVGSEIRLGMNLYESRLTAVGAYQLEQALGNARRSALVYEGPKLIDPEGREVGEKKTGEYQEGWVEKLEK